jgi:hypothetical protein
MNRNATRSVILLSAFCASVSTSCEREEKVSNYKPFFSGLEGVQTKTPATKEETKKPALAGAGDDTVAASVHENPDGTVTIIAKTGRQLMAHILRTLADEPDPAEAAALKDQFTKQVLSDLTRMEYLERGLSPDLAFADLKKNRKEIAKLFNRMPMGEYSPNVLMEQLARNVIRVKLTGQARKGMDKWTGFDMILEKGNWRLRWFVP